MEEQKATGDAVKARWQLGLPGASWRFEDRTPGEKKLLRGVKEKQQNESTQVPEKLIFLKNVLFYLMQAKIKQSYKFQAHIFQADRAENEEVSFLKLHGSLSAALWTTSLAIAKYKFEASAYEKSKQELPLSKSSGNSIQSLKVVR